MRQILREFGLGEHESPRTLLDIILAAGGGFACLLFLSFIFEKKSSPELQHNAFVSVAVVLAAILLAKNRVAVILGMIAIVVLRGLVAALLYGYWRAFALTLLAGLIFYFGARWYGNRTG